MKMDLSPDRKQNRTHPCGLLRAPERNCDQACRDEAFPQID